MKLNLWVIEHFTSRYGWQPLWNEVFPTRKLAKARLKKLHFSGRVKQYIRKGGVNENLGK